MIQGIILVTGGSIAAHDLKLCNVIDISFEWSQKSPPLVFQPQNILLTSKSPLGDVKIVDFGLSRIMKSSEELREIMGTPEYVGKLLP